MNNKLKIIFLLATLEIGGVSNMLIETLEHLDINKYNIDIIVFEKKDELLKKLSQNIKVIEINKNNYEGIKRKISKTIRRFLGSGIFFIAKYVYHLVGNKFISKEKNNSNEYDVAIAFQDGMATWYTAKNIWAKHKIAVVHTDFKRAQYNPKSEQKIYSIFEKIYCTSNTAKNSFCKCIQGIEFFTEVWTPHIDKKELLEKAYNFNKEIKKIKEIRIVTLARLSHEKGIDKAIRALAQLNKEGYSIEWYFIGDGPEKDNLQKLAENLGCKNNVNFLGNLLNPYCMLLSSDIYVQPSNYESYCIALAEARALECAIVTSDFPSAYEQLGENGGIIAGSTWITLYDGIKRMIDNPQLRENFSKECKTAFPQNTQYSNPLIDYLEENYKFRR